jgi:hypothetical protein
MGCASPVLTLDRRRKRHAGRSHRRACGLLPASSVRERSTTLDAPGPRWTFAGHRSDPGRWQIPPFAPAPLPSPTSPASHAPPAQVSDRGSRRRGAGVCRGRIGRNTWLMALGPSRAGFSRRGGCRWRLRINPAPLGPPMLDPVGDWREQSRSRSERAAAPRGDTRGASCP